MAIETDEYVKYDLTGRYYYLTEAGAIHYTGLNDISSLWPNTELRLKRQARKLHEKYITSPYTNRSRFSHKDLIEYKVFKNENGERQGIIDSLIAMAEAAYYDEWDLSFNDKDFTWIQSVIMPIYNAQVYIEGRICGEVPEDEYQIGY